MNTFVDYVKGRFVGLVSFILSLIVGFFVFSFLSVGPIFGMGVGGIMTHRVSTYQSLAASTALPITIKSMHVSGLLVLCSTDFQGTETLTVTRFHQGGGSTNMVVGLPFNELVRISDANYGFSGAGRTAVDETAPTLPSVVYIPLGSIFLGSGSLEVNIVNGTVAKTFGVYAVDIEEYADYMFQYQKTVNDNLAVELCHSVYMFHNTPGTALIAVAVDVQVRRGVDGYVTDASGGVAASMLFGKQEEYYVPDMALIYSNDKDLPETVALYKSGASAASVSFVSIGYVFVERLTSASTIQTMSELGFAVKELESQKPEIAKAMRHAGMIQSADEYASRLAVMKP